MKLGQQRGGKMGAVLQFILNLFIVIGTVVPFLAAAMLIAYRTAGLQERVIRGLAMFTATLVVLGSQAAGLTVGKGVVSMLEIRGFGGLVIRVAWILLAGFAGAMLSKYLTKHLDGSTTTLQIRVMVFVGWWRTWSCLRSTSAASAGMVSR
jgi:hypothetical protein